MTTVATTLRSAYLAGPMRGYESYNFPAFHKATAKLRAANWSIFSPAERDEADEALNGEWGISAEGRGLDYFMQFDLAAVCQTDCVIVLKDWEFSQGARLETAVAVELGHPVFEFVTRRFGKFELVSVNPTYIQSMFALNAAAGPLHEEVGGCQDTVGCRCRSNGDDCNCGDPSQAWEPTEEQVVQLAAAIADGSIIDYGPADEGPALVSNDPTEIEEYLAAGERDTTRERYAEDGKLSLVSALPTGSEARKGVPLASGLLDYFPAALAEVARVSKAGNDKHNPGQPMHHARGKSTDHADCLLRHLVDRGKVDAETGQRHSGEVAWRALALLQQELEDEGLAPLPRGAKL